MPRTQLGPGEELWSSGTPLANRAHLFLCSQFTSDPFPMFTGCPPHYLRLSLQCTKLGPTSGLLCWLFLLPRASQGWPLLFMQLIHTHCLLRGALRLPWRPRRWNSLCGVCLALFASLPLDVSSVRAGALPALFTVVSPSQEGGLANSRC